MVDRVQSLEIANKILKEVNKVNIDLLTKDTLEWDEVDRLLCEFGNIVNADRAHLFEKVILDTGECFYKQRFEWINQNNPVINCRDSQEIFQTIPCFDVYDRWYDLLEQEKPVYGKVEEFNYDEQNLLLRNNIKSIAIVPVITMNGERKIWGSVGFDDCSIGRFWSEIEIEALLALSRSISILITNIRTREQKDKAMSVLFNELRTVNNLQRLEYNKIRDINNEIRGAA